MLLLYVAISFAVWPSFETGNDNPGYTDPAASYVLGQGFTSGCWYAQEHDEFWAGNAPLHQFLLIPCFKVFGFGYGPLQLLELLYISLAMVLLWLSAARSGLILSAGWRLGAVAFFLVSDCSLCLATSGRQEPICLVIVCAAWFAMTLENRFARFSGLAICALLAPWAGLQLALFIGFMGIGSILLFQRRYLREVIVLAGGGIVGLLTLLFFYKQMGVLDKFLASISPHTGIAALHTATTGVEHIRENWGHRLGGLKCVSVLWTLFLFVLVSAQNLSNKRSWGLIGMSLGCIIGIPACFAGLGVFQPAYGCYLLLPISVYLFALLSRNPTGNTLRTKIILFLLLLSAVLPGAFLWRFAIQGIPSALNDSHKRMDAFVKKTTHPDDVAYVDSRLWYATKPQIKETTSSYWDALARTSKDREKISVVIIFPSSSHMLNDLPGEWRPTGEFLELPDFHRFYRIFDKSPPYRFVVFRRVDRP